jgi:hypothetical protein
MKPVSADSAARTVREATESLHAESFTGPAPESPAGMKLHALAWSQTIALKIHNEDIGHIGPSPVVMSSRGTFVAQGILFHDEIKDNPVLKDLPVILQAHTDPGDLSSPLVRVYAKIIDATVDSVSTIERQSRNKPYLLATFEIIREAIPGPSGPCIQPWTPKTMGGFRVRWPRSADLDLMGFPRQGISLGMQKSGTSQLPYLLPVQALYRSLFVVGGMGGGKTNLISTLARAIANRPTSDFVGHRRPAVVILDAEGRHEYSDLGVDVRRDLRADVEDAGIAPHGVRDFRYFRIAPHEWTFRLADVTPQDTAIFPATLPAKSERQWKLGAEAYWRRAQSVGRDVLATEFSPAMAGAAMPLGLNASMRTALVRAAQDSCWEVFDMPDTPALGTGELLVPGRVSVVDVSRLEGLDRQRSAGLALLTIFDIAKRSEPQHPCPVLLVIDEATRLVPASFAGMSGREYSEKMGSWLGDVLHRGRRAGYGLLIATQYPDDVLKGLADQPQTKICFSLPPKYDRWVNSNFGTAAGETLRTVARVGVGYISRTSRVDGDPVGAAHPPTLVKFPQVR